MMHISEWLKIKGTYMQTQTRESKGRGHSIRQGGDSGTNVLNHSGKVRYKADLEVLPIRVLHDIGSKCTEKNLQETHEDIKAHQQKEIYVHLSDHDRLGEGKNPSHILTV